MRRVLLGLVGMIAAGASRAETYTFTAVVDNAFRFTTMVDCAEPPSGRIPSKCTLREPAVAWPNNKHLGPVAPGVRCRAGHLITFHRNGTA